MNYIKIFSCLLFIALLTGCFSKTQPLEEEKVLNIYFWENYMAEDTVSNFEDEFGINVNVDYFEDENVLISEIQTNPEKYDLIIASGNVINEMIDLRLLYPLDFEKITNYNNIDKKFKNFWYDQENTYSVPYLWGTTGIAINTKYVPADTNSWAVLWNSKYAGKIGMLNDKNEVISSALKYLGYSLNTKEPRELENAKTALINQKPLVYAYEDPESLIELMVSEKIYLAQMYSGDALLAKESNPNIEYLIPKEGSALWIDNLAIPKEAKHKENAEKFINYVLRQEVSAAIANHVNFANPNWAARSRIKKELLNNPKIYVPEEMFLRMENIKSDGSSINRKNKIWAEIMIS